MYGNGGDKMKLKQFIKMVFEKRTRSPSFNCVMCGETYEIQFLNDYGVCVDCVHINK